MTNITKSGAKSVLGRLSIPIVAPSPFRTFLEENISFKDFLDLPEKLGVSQHMITRISSKPESMTVKQLSYLSVVVNTPPLELYHRFKCAANNATEKDLELINNIYTKKTLRA